MSVVISFNFNLVANSLCI